MDDFCRVWNDYNRHPKKTATLKSKLINCGMNIIKPQNPNEMKEMVLTKLIYSFPNDADLYYRMGCLFHPFSVDKAVMWYRLAHQQNPAHLDNLFVLCKTLYSCNQYQMFVELNIGDVFDRLISNNLEFLFYYLTCKLSLNLFHKSEIYAKRLEMFFSEKTQNTEDVKLQYWSILTELCRIYYTFGNIDKAVEYGMRAHRVARTSEMKRTAYQFLICLNDYRYIHTPIDYTNYTHHPSFQFKQRDTTKKLRIGYVSSDFGLHAVSNFILPILQHHDTTKFDVFLFPNSKYIHPTFVALNLPTIYLFELNAKEAAKRINENNIDILMDLNGHTVHNRLDVFALCPAPVQMSYIGFPNTTGLKSIQYRITDAIADPPDTTQFATEQLLRLPSCFLLYKSAYQTAPLPVKKTNDLVVLGSFNREPKNSAETLETWKAIMRECLNCVIVIKMDTADNVEERMAFYTRHLGVDRKRVLLIPRPDDDEYIRMFAMIDILLDTFPYSGTTTTCNALYNSIPVVSLTHPNIHAHNVSASILMHARLPELVGHTVAEYVSIATNLISNPVAIDEYKHKIHSQFMTLMNPHTFMGAYEELLSNTQFSFSV
jgi:predicted O-linked N-acetylglucosamine transferase (SPINDLY family)